MARVLARLAGQKREQIIDTHQAFDGTGLQFPRARPLPERSVGPEQRLQEGFWLEARHLILQGTQPARGSPAGGSQDGRARSLTITADSSRPRARGPGVRLEHLAGLPSPALHQQLFENDCMRIGEMGEQCAPVTLELRIAHETQRQDLPAH
jgi:hypothetical protein